MDRIKNASQESKGKLISRLALGRQPKTYQDSEIVVSVGAKKLIRKMWPRVWVVTINDQSFYRVDARQTGTNGKQETFKFFPRVRLFRGRG